MEINVQKVLSSYNALIKELISGKTANVTFDYREGAIAGLDKAKMILLEEMAKDDPWKGFPGSKK